MKCKTIGCGEKMKWGGRAYYCLKCVKDGEIHAYHIKNI